MMPKLVKNAVCNAQPLYMLKSTATIIYVSTIFNPHSTELVLGNYN